MNKYVYYKKTIFITLFIVFLYAMGSGYGLRAFSFFAPKDLTKYDAQPMIKNDSDFYQMLQTLRYT